MKKITLQKPTIKSKIKTIKTTALLDLKFLKKLAISFYNTNRCV
jgi:hypothetical protein